jgi:TetR/AcrR family transcriptional repressor of nem operon
MPRSALKHHRRETAPGAARLTRTARKRRIVEQAVQVFAERGYHGTTPELIAEAAGVAEAILVGHFADKAALFGSVLDEVRAATVERWRSETATLPDPLAKLHAVAELYLGAARSDVAEIRLLHRALADCDGTEVAAPLRSFFRECATFLAGILAEGQQAGVFRRSLDPRVGAWQLLHVGLGLAATRPLALPSDGESLARDVECLLHGLLKTDV